MQLPARIISLSCLSALALMAMPLAWSDTVVETRALANAHAHNDYWHKRPLLDALSHGFSSAEADIFLVDGELLVGHDRAELEKEKSLEKLYLAPLLARCKKNEGRVHAGGPEFTLLVDLKSDGPTTYRALAALLAKYETMLSTVRDGTLTRRGVRVVISGNRPRALMESEKIRRAGYDGRLSDIDDDCAPHFMPLVSDRWGTHFTWRGEGTMPVEERRKLEEIVKKAHAAHCRVRFWATPEAEAVWEELLRAGVDLVNTDELARLERYLRARATRRREAF